MRFIFRYLKKYRRDFGVGLLCLVATNGLSLSIPWLLKSVVEGLRSGSGQRVVAGYAVTIALIAIAVAIVRTRSRLKILGASRRIVCNIREELFAHLLRLPSSFYARHRTGEIMSRAVNDLRLVRSLFGPGVLSVIDVALLYSAGLTLMVLLDPVLTLLSVLPYPFLLLGVARLSRTIHRHSNATQEQLAEISNKAQENLIGINMIKAYGREETEIEVFEALSREYRKRSLDLARSRALVVSCMVALGGLSTVIVFWVGGRHVIEGSLSLGGLVAFMSYLALLTRPTIMMGWILGVLQRGLGAVRRVEEILIEQSDLPGDRVIGPGPGITGEIELRRLDFRYPTGGDRPAPEILSGIDLRVTAGSTVGIVGRVGSGKSTLVSLLSAVYPVADGAVFLDGHDLNRIPTDHLRAHVALVPQENYLFSRTIAENIALGRPDASRERIEEVARIAGISGDLDELPHGLDTMVGERGVTLSGGQRQRVALARALLLDPRILILDDALSSVDARTEEVILRELRGYTRSRTTLLISHRMATVFNADRIVALESGRITESGSPQELLAGDGLFARMYRQQQIENELEAL